MRLIKNEFVRFFTAGFVSGALIVAVTMGLGSTTAAASSTTPVATVAALR